MKPKIKIKDNDDLRAEIYELYEKTNQVDLARWSLILSKHILDLADIDYNFVDEIKEGFNVNMLWQEGNARMHDVRQVGFKIHKLARECNDEIKKAALRTAGQAVGSGHMKEHSMVASDYAIKTIDLISSCDIKAITNERQWQLKELIKIINKGGA